MMATSQSAEMSVRLSLTVVDVDYDVYEYTLSTYDSPDDTGAPPANSVWERTNPEPPGSEYDITITAHYSREEWNVEDIEKGTGILTTDEQICEMFESALMELSFQRQKDIADGIEHEHNTGTVSIDSDPYDPKLIRVEPKTFPAYHVYDMIQEGDIDLSPDFQREFVWSDIKRRSRLIESLLLRIPLPVFYLAQDEDGTYQVVDGVQRLTVLRDFMSNKFKLRDMEYLKDCNGKWFNDKNRDPSESLERVYVKRIQQTMLSFNVIDPQTPSKVKYDIFRRINTGGKELNRQEIRNCFETPRTRDYIRSLSESDVFLCATRHSIKPVRMADKEIILRFLAFFMMDEGIGGQRAYRGDMDTFLDDTVDVLNKLPDEQLAEMKAAFFNAMENAYLLFGDSAFRKAKLINKALFLSWTRVLSHYEPQELKQHDIGTKISDGLQKRIASDVSYSDALSKGTNDVRNLDKCLNVADELMKGVV